MQENKNQIDLRLVWLDEAAITSGKVVDKISAKEVLGQKLPPVETEYAKVCGAYLYLLKLAKDSNLLVEKDEILTRYETIH